MLLPEFQRLAEKRQNWVKASKENNFNFEGILTGLYNDPSHFVYEILQNAEDAGATKVTFELLEDRLEIYHDGEDFDFRDVEGVTGFGTSKKKDDINAIGKFGVGFKSVFAITQSPIIRSGEYHFKIDEFVVPTALNKEQIDATKIVLPFEHKIRSRDDIFKLVNDKIEDIGLKSLLFLRNIEEVKWKSPRNSGHYLKSSKAIDNIPNARRVTIISQAVDGEYVVIERPFDIEIEKENKIEKKTVKVEVAFKIGKDKSGKEIILQEPDSKLVVFFPTEKVTFLNFLVQGPYKTTHSRENIPLEDEQNKLIIRETGTLVAESLLIIKELGYLDLNFLNILPLDSKHCESEPIYDHIFRKVKERFLADEELLPTHNGKFAKVTDVLLARGPLTEIFDIDDIKFLFSKKYWLNTGITEGSTRELRDYLKKELQVKEVEYQDVAVRVTADFLIRKNDEWMISFYNSLLKQQWLWELETHSHKGGVLHGRPIIRLEDNSHIAPYNESGEIQAYLPTEYKSEYRTVKKLFIENKGASDFLNKLGLRHPELFDEIIKFTLPKYKANYKGQKLSEEEYFDDFDKVLTFFNETDSKGKPEELISKISEVTFILSVEYKCKKPNEIYLNTPELKQYFEGYESVSFVSEKLYDRFEKKGVVDFLKKIGVIEVPKRIEFNPKLSYEERTRLRNNQGHTSDIELKDFAMEGLENFLGKKIDLEKSVLLWSMLLKSLSLLDRWGAKFFFEGMYKWQYYSIYQKTFDSTFLKTLKTTKWLIDKEGNLKSPSEIILSELPDEYLKEAPNIDVLKEKLCFKPDIFDQLPEDIKYKLKLIEGLSPEKLKEVLALGMKKESETKDKPDVWTPECEPAEADITIVDMSPVPLEPPQLEGQAGKLSDGKETKGDDPPKGKESEKTKELSLVDKKAIGEWGEKQVFNSLKERFEKDGEIEDTDLGFRLKNNRDELIEVFWLNMKSEKGVGYDFVIKTNNEENEYIEVKSKLDENPELVEITGTQFEFARKLNDEGRGEKYSIYVVVNAGKKAKIKRLNNPVKLWKDGKLRAHPVHFWL